MLTEEQINGLSSVTALTDDQKNDDLISSIMLLTGKQLADNKKEFIDLLNKVNRPGMKDLIDWISNLDPSVCDFFTAPSSTVYHGNFIGGLCRHSLNVYHALVALVPVYYNLCKTAGRTPVQITEEQCIVTALLHDLCKTLFYTTIDKVYKDKTLSYGNQWVQYRGYTIDDHFPFGHGDKSCFLIQRFIKLTGVEALAIRWHMGSTIETMEDANYKFAYSKAMEICPLACLLHQADLTAAFLMDNKKDVPGRMK